MSGGNGGRSGSVSIGTSTVQFTGPRIEGRAPDFPSGRIGPHVPSPVGRRDREPVAHDGRGEPPACLPGPLDPAHHRPGPAGPAPRTAPGVRRLLRLALLRSPDLAG